MAGESAPRGLVERVLALFPGARITSVQQLPGESAEGATTKSAGYGSALRIVLREADGGERSLAFHTATANDFGHDRRSDRAQELLLAYDTFGSVPGHVRAFDVGAIADDGSLLPLVGAGEFYLLTTFAPGQLYAEDLRRVAREGAASALDMQRCQALARYLVELHSARGGRPAAYRRAIRDLVGHGEGVFGMIDGYPPDVPSAPPSRLEAIERRCVEWRWRLRGGEARLSRIHGDFHPFNVVFAEGTTFSLLDASRGAAGEPADDVACMAVNYLFFALDAKPAWARGLGMLWRRFWTTYLAGSGDSELLSVAAPFLAWRALVLANPRWYPRLSPGARDALLGFVERALDGARLEPASAEALFR